VGTTHRAQRETEPASRPNRLLLKGFEAVTKARVELVIDPRKSTVVSLTIGFRAWARSVLGPSIQSVFVGSLGAGVIMVALNFAHQAFGGGTQPSWISNYMLDGQDQIVVALVAVILLMLIASIVQSGVSQVDSLIVRQYIRRVIHERAAHEPNLASRIVSERFLLEAWSGLQGASVQLLVLTLALLYFSGGSVIFGAAVALVVLLAACWVFFKKAKEVSMEFFSAKAEAQKAERRAKNKANIPKFKKARAVALDRVREAIYRRDTTVLRIPFLQNVAISALALGAILFPAVTTLNTAQLTTVLLVAFLWRQNALEIISTLGRTVWTYMSANLSATRRVMGGDNSIFD
jgi:hypothetical protein